MPYEAVSAVGVPSAIQITKQGVSAWQFFKNLPATSDPPEVAEAKDVFLYAKNSRKGKKAAVFGMVGLVVFKATSALMALGVEYIHSTWPHFMFQQNVLEYVLDYVPTTAGSLSCAGVAYLVGRIENWFKQRHLSLEV
jgi:hypothetical protein